MVIFVGDCRFMRQKSYTLKYYHPAEDSVEGWEKYSLPLGNGYLGANIFGRTDSERLQFTTNVFANDYDKGGVSNFAEIRLDFGFEIVEKYERGLNLNEGVAYVKYRSGKNRVKNSAFFSYPDQVFVYQVESTEHLDYNVKLVIPYLGARTPEEGGRTGDVYVKDKRLIMRGTLPFRELIYEGQIVVLSDGIVIGDNNALRVSNATKTTILFVADTSYKLDESVFLEGNQKAIGDDPHEKIEQRIRDVIALGYDKLLERHQRDYCNLYSRVQLDLGGQEDGRSTEELLESYQQGNYEPYLEELYYQYGRYLLIASSRKGTPPSSLQGVWSVYDKSPWGSGYWHNINVQMNYWPAFNANLAETFAAYADFNKAFRKQAEIYASDKILERFPERYVEGQGECGWTIGTAAYCYQIYTFSKNTHSGPGTGGLTTKLFWDYYDFTRDEDILRDVTYPAIHGMSKFLIKYVRDYDGEFLIEESASPEQIIGGKWIEGAETQPYYHTVGCAFDQQMLYENAMDDLKCAELIGVSDDITELEKSQIEKYSPVIVGYSGQVKEYREEKFYGEIGELHHRHISQLVALSPGTAINRETPAWLDAAKRTLELRGEQFLEGWAYAHRMCAWARIGDGEKAYAFFKKLLKERTYVNLWNNLTLFQIDGNFGAVNGITEMLLQSHEGCVHLLPAIPERWKNVSVKGLKARGNFTVSFNVVNGNLSSLTIESVVGGHLKIRHIGMRNVVVHKSSGEEVSIKTDDMFCCFETLAGEIYAITGFENVGACSAPENLSAVFEGNGVKLTWQGNEKEYAVYRAVGNDSGYTLLGYTEKCYFVDCDYNIEKQERLTYRVTSIIEIPAKEQSSIAFLYPSKEMKEV